MSSVKVPNANSKNVKGRSGSRRGRRGALSKVKPIGKESRRLLSLVRRELTAYGPKGLKEDSMIPFAKAHFNHGTQNPVFRLRCSSAVLSSTAGSTITASVSPTLSAVADTASWQAIFDEYRVLEVYLHYRPAFLGGTTNTGIIVWATDYDDNGVLSSYDSAIAYDEHVVEGLNHPLTLTGKIDWLPDMEWITTATPSTVTATFKPYANSTTGVGISTTYGFYWTEMLIQFRAVD